jgi:hypothetical protein
MPARHTYVKGDTGAVCVSGLIKRDLAGSAASGAKRTFSLCRMTENPNDCPVGV